MLRSNNQTAVTLFGSALQGELMEEREQSFLCLSWKYSQLWWKQNGFNRERKITWQLAIFWPYPGGRHNHCKVSLQQCKNIIEDTTKKNILNIKQHYHCPKCIKTRLLLVNTISLCSQHVTENIWLFKSPSHSHITLFCVITQTPFCEFREQHCHL